MQITDSEGQQQKTGKTAEETLATLNRDIANANENVAKQDLTKIQESQEMAQVIGELSQSWLNRAVKAPLEEADKKRQEAEEIAKTNPAQAERLRSEAKALEAEYGLGSNLQMGVRAATAALQGLATGDVKQAAVGAISPYLNKAIKEATTNADGSLNKEANLIAHTILGVVEAKATGNNAVAGGLAALTAEAAAPIVMQQLYGTDNPGNLTEKQKQNVANLSQIAAGLAGGLVGDSTASGIAGAEIGKRAVENNSFGISYAQHQKDEELRKKDPEAYKKEMEERSKLMKDATLAIGGTIFIPLLPEVAATSSLIAGGFGGGSELVGQLVQNDWDISKVDGKKVAVQLVLALQLKIWGS